MIISVFSPLCNTHIILEFLWDKFIIRSCIRKGIRYSEKYQRVGHALWNVITLLLIFWWSWIHLSSHTVLHCYLEVTVPVSCISCICICISSAHQITLLVCIFLLRTWEADDKILFKVWHDEAYCQSFCMLQFGRFIAYHLPLCRDFL